MAFKRMFESPDEPDAVPETKSEDIKERKQKSQLAWHSIKTISNKSIIIEYVNDDTVNRVVLPLGAVTEHMTLTTLESGVQYGLAWSKVIKGADKKIEAMLRAAGIWTKDDFVQNHAIARGVLESNKLSFSKALMDINKFVKNGGKNND